MRDREGKGIVNAHILGFLRRISKLLYYGINKPVFVFDGGVPTLKRQTIIPSATETDTDHRLATEVELKEFIHEFTPEDLDINSPHFQSLSTELKCEIIGDLRVKSRQPNRTRVEAMRKTTDHEFSQTQILNLKKRNNLTQKLLTVTDMVAKANLTISIKIAPQPNKEYVLVKASCTNYKPNSHPSSLKAVPALTYPDLLFSSSSKEPSKKLWQAEVRSTYLSPGEIRAQWLASDFRSYQGPMNIS
ncbi:hypothetical protein MJO29_006205 [Puccinia striiformis f. sp. tritici]|nr:hypothetical protein MJO29_006205 [Puccinia striiformis f. sp. tritici]KAI9605013.1 hypothetical protein H4Q26_002984 [Puccinia striiformis f. sp. tritici PST-130]KNE91254.1 hypothetical protein PSTG_15320 [Puccinia striiformis f. sp. tritici PST-78]